MSERVWDKFLTEQDKASLRSEGPDGKRVGYGTRPALLLVDLYRWVFGDEPQPLLEAIKTWPGSCGLNGWNALPHIQKLLATAREVGCPIVHITMMNNDGLVGWSEAAHRDTYREPTDPAMLERLSRKTDIVDEVAPIAGELVLRKATPSAFCGTPLLSHLQYHDIDTLLVVGESTSGCVRATVVDGTSFRFRVIVAEEGVFDRHEAPHAINLFDMHQKYADVVPVDEIIDYLQRWKAAQPQAVPVLS
jgi:nicotinamidase-related amidase